MAGAIVGGAVLSAALQVLFDRIASRPVIDFIRGHKLSDAPLWKLKTVFSTVGALLNDAEEKQFNSRAVKAWLHELKDATYDAEDLLDEIVTEASRCKLEAESCTFTDQLRNYMSTFRNPFDEGIKSKIEEILNRLEYIAGRKDFLGLREVAGGELSRNFPTTSLVEESGMFGRDDDKKEIIKMLLSDGASGNELDVITIVGMGGLGKTTLAQFVYNDDEVEKHFDLKAWVCVSDESDLLGVTKTIFEAITRSTCDNIKGLNMLHMELKEKFSGKKFLLVLDDIWNDDYIFWETLQRPFKFGAKGSRIIVTTRKESVASRMGTVQAHHLKLLVEEDCWSLFAKHAFNNVNSGAHPHLEVIGREIVNKCKGLPLAAKALGGLLRSKFDVEEWNKILRSNIWDLQSDILPTLRLSYHYLPSDLKQCFAYCAIFPNDYEFEKERLILLWMAEGFLQHPYENRRMEEVGEDFFRDLVSRSFFQRSTRDKSRFVMHDLINDLAKIVYGEFCSSLEGENLRQIPKKTRHLSYFPTKYDVSKKFEAFNDAKRLRTFLPLTLGYNCDLTKKVPHDLLSTRNYLRVLSLSHYCNIRELPESIGSLKHLRYLDLSFTEISRLPDSTSTLFNLQTLLLPNCRSLTELPIDMGKLINLRHLDVSGTSLKEMPMHMSRLKSLQTLSTFIVGNCNGSTITELRKFQHLRGALHIMELQKVDGARDALRANLKNREYLDELVLEWGSSNENSQVERDVLDNLQPHANLKRLTIKDYRSTRFPDWVVDHSLCGNMVYLCLENCKYCFSLPSLGQLPCLKDLSIIGFDGVEIVGTEFYGNGSCTNKPFGALEILRFEEMSQWVEWLCLGDEGREFPLLRELYIKKCPKLVKGLPGHLPSLTKIVISKCQLLVASLPRAPSTRAVDLIDCNKVVLRRNDEVSSHPTLDVPQSSNVTSCQPQPHDDQMTKTLPNPVGLQHLCSVVELCVSRVSSQLMELPPCLRSLWIMDCPRLKSFPKGGLPTTLRALCIDRCRELELFPHEEEETMHNHYASLKSLFISRSCDLLKSFPLGLFPKVQYLCFSTCKNVESLCIPEEGLLEDLTSLRSLRFRHCPKFVSFPIGGLPTPNLTCLDVTDCENLKSLPERMHTRLSSLQELYINRCPELESSLEGGLPFNLMKVQLSVHQMEWGLQTLPSLTEFSIWGCEEVESFPEEWLPPSTLTSLEIWDCPNLKYLDKSWLQHLTSLEKLIIRRCPLLEQRCQREKGKDWPNIAHIPCIVIDGELIS